MADGHQLRLLLWKDYLTRKRNFITLSGIIWASGIIFAMYIVRINISNQDFPTCQFPARALPSAGMLPFLQSFICSVDNECAPLDKFEEIPAYRNAKFTQIRKKFEPLLNESVLELASTMPDAGKILATLANVADEPTFRDFTLNGLRVNDLFKDPARVKRYIRSYLTMNDDVAESLMTAQISFEGLLKGNVNRCNVDFMSRTLLVENEEHLKVIVERICTMSSDDMQNIMMNLIYEVNFSKYINMLGSMYYKLSGDDSITRVGEFLTALLRMAKIQHFLPLELADLFLGSKTDFSYFDLKMVPKFIDLFRPTFEDTDEYKTLREFSDMAVTGVQYMDKIFGNLNNDAMDVSTDVLVSNQGHKIDIKRELGKITKILNNTMDTIESLPSMGKTVDPFNVLTQLMNFVYKFLTKDKQHEVLFYSTLIAKLMESAHNVIMINTHIEETAYNVTLRNPQAIKILKDLPPQIIGKTFDALVSAERTQILTSKLNFPGQMFCDVSRLQNFFFIDNDEAESIKKLLCTEAWKNFVKNVFNSFGVFDVKENINEMASLFIQETLGKDTSSELYTLEKDFQIFKDFVSALVTIESEKRPELDWKKLLDIDDNSQFMKIVKEKSHLAKLILISVHGALAKEIVKQNVLLQYKITPMILDATTTIVAFHEQLEAVPPDVTKNIRNNYGDIIRTILLTALNEEKTYKSLSTYGEDIFCTGGQNAAMYLDFPDNTNIEELSSALCDATIQMEKVLQNDSALAIAIAKISNTTHTMAEEINWTRLINSIQKLYTKLDKDYPYLFEFSTYAMDNVTQEEVLKTFQAAKDYWFSINYLQRSLHLSLKLIFRLLDIVDCGIFNVTNIHWIKMKYAASITIGPLGVLDDTIQLVTAIMTNSSYTSNLPPSIIHAMGKILPGLPQLIIDAVNVIVKDDTEMEPIISIMNAEPAWPCSTSSISKLLNLSSSSQEAVQSLETLMCMNENMQHEWGVYIEQKRAKINSNKNVTWEDIEFEPHLFLKFSSLFDSLINDTIRVRDTLLYIFLDRNSEDHIGLVTAFEYAIEVMNSIERNEILRKFLHKIDVVINSITTSTSLEDKSINSVWENYIACMRKDYSDDRCTDAARSTWKHTLKMLSVILDNIAIDLTTYFNEVNEPDSNALQVIGFTKNTTFYILYDRLPEFLSVLLNSYWDFSFMSQIRKASQTQFWDCEAVVSALSPAPDSSIQTPHILKVKPYLCPSFIYWISLPRDDNVLFNLVAKPQYFLYTMPVQNATSQFESAFTKATDLTAFLDNISKENNTKIKDDFKIDNSKTKLANFMDKLLTYKINETNPMYIQFSNVYKKKFVSNIYLIRVVSMVNKMASTILNTTIKDNADGSNKEEVKKLNADLKIIKNIFKRRSTDAIEIFYDVITDLLWRNDNAYTIIDAIEFSCANIKDKSKTILVDEERVKAQLCAKNYKTIFGEAENILAADYEDARQSLLDFVEIIKSPDDEIITDIFVYLNNKQKYMKSLKDTVKNSYEVGLPLFLKYLQSNLQSYNVVLTLMTGGNWWHEMRNIFNGPYAVKFFNVVESVFEIMDHFLNNLDEIHLVRLAHDMNLTETMTSFCRPNITLSDYLPDGTGLLSELKTQICTTNQNDLFMEIPPLLYTSQGYEPDLVVSKDVDYEALDADITRTKTNIDLLASGPKEPQRPPWVTDERLKVFRKNMMNLISKETITKAVFGVMSNGVDAGTLFLNSSYCSVCSKMTSWFKQLNLQLFKKQEYDGLLCHLNSMTLEEIHQTLKNDFHWDMFIREIISTRNYTKYELNKSMNEFLGLVKIHLLEDMRSPTTKLTECLAKNVTMNALGYASISITVLAHTIKLLQAPIPHIHEIEGIKNIQYFNQLFSSVAHNLDIYKPLKNYVRDVRTDLRGIIMDDEVMMDIENADVNLRIIRNATTLPELVKLHTNKWEHICEDSNCETIFKIIIKELNQTRMYQELPILQSESFWNFTFIGTILHHTEKLLSHAGRLLGTVSDLDVRGAVSGRLQALLDVALTVLTDDGFDSIVYSLQGLIEEFHPLLRNTALESDLGSITAGLRILHQLKTYLVEEEDLNLQVSKMFPNPDAMELGLTALGINNTNFWSIAAPRIQAGYLMLKPVLSPKDTPTHISSYVCQLDTMSSVIAPGALDVVTSEDVLAATADQFCGLPDARVKQIVPVLARNIDIGIIVDRIKDFLLAKLYVASSVTAEQGSKVLQRFPRMASLLPTLQANLGDVLDSLGDEPLFRSLQDFSSIGNLMTSSDFMANAGNMLCGKPFQGGAPRIIKSIISSQDMTVEADQAQLDVLPTDFCRSMYKEITSVEGGKIVWSFVKPLIMGRILYTPSHPTVDKIIQRVNVTFASMMQMSNLVRSFAAAFPSLDSISSHRQGLDALQHLVKAPGLGELRKVLLGQQEFNLNVDVEGLFSKVGDVKGIGSLLSKASNLLECVNLNRLRAVTDEQELMTEAGKLMAVNEFSAGIVFLNVDQLNDSMTQVEYKIRMDIENAPTTKWMKPYLWTPGPEASFIENMRYFRGHVQIQDLVERAIIQLAAETSRTKRHVTSPPDWAVYTQQEPYPCYRKDFFQSSLYESQALLVGLFFALLFSVTSAVRFIVADHESGNTMLMSVMGVELKYHTLSWFLSSLCELSVTVAVMTAILRWGEVLPRTDPTLVFALLFLFVVSVLSFCYLMSKLFTSASFAAVCSGLAYLVTFMPFILILSLEAVMDSSLKMIVCLSMSSSVMYSFLYITRYEAMGVGARWAHIWDSPNGDDMCIAYAAGMLVVDALIYLAVGWTIDRYFGIKSVSSNISHSKRSKAGVTVSHVTKMYGNKMALADVSMELRCGEITALLGHNGAGKTTLINILTGMLKPTKGTITIHSEHDSPTRLGVCPQKDVLFEYMTPREHVALYAQLVTGRGSGEVQGEVDRMMRVLSLGGVGEVRAAALSGGTRRRLCVALAFVGAPPLVSLDEPTAGVDPAARRDIWSMIVKLKENRTILLTTHHLDEAELLSDQIVIMHKGQIHTTGSPVEIKRSLGSGYKLTISLPEKCEDWESSVQEKTKQILALVRDVVKNAEVVDVNEGQVEIGLPYYGEDGDSNNFGEVCQVLEKNQVTLGYDSFAMDCSTLEEVFYEICRKVDSPINDTVEEHTSKSISTSSLKSEQSLVPAEGVLRGSTLQQFRAVMHARALHHMRNRWLLFMLIALPSIFVTVAMAFSTLRPPADNEIALRLSDHLYPNSTQYLVPHPSIYLDTVDPSFAQHVMNQLKVHKKYRDWTETDTPSCKCEVTHQQCEAVSNLTKPELLIVPDVETLNTWLVNSQDVYLEDRYGGFTSTIQNNKTNLIAWYNNKGFHAMPSYLNVLNNAILRTVAGSDKKIIAYSHPMKISQEQISKNTVYQHVADAGVAALVLVAYALASAAGCVLPVAARARGEARLLRLCGAPPALPAAAAALTDATVILINMAITATVMWLFGFPVFVARNNLPAICLLIFLYGFACGSLVHLLEKLFTEASLANMMLFCGNTFLGLSGITLLLILDIISESDRTDYARWVLHKIFMLSPQFALGDGLIEIAKNTIQAQVLGRFGMDTYRDPLTSTLILLHYCSLLAVGVALAALNLALDYGCFDWIAARMVPASVYEAVGERLTPEPEDVSEERRRVAADVADLNRGDLLTVSTLGNINRGFVQTEGKQGAVRRVAGAGADAMAYLSGVGKAHGARVAVRAISLAVPRSQCVALLGENGAGKSTTFSLLTGEKLPTRGEIYLDGERCGPRELNRGLISYCPQNNALDPLLTVQETLEMYCRLRGITDIDRVTAAALGAFELGRYARARVGALSGGNRRKLSAALALAARAPLVLLDEPTSGMDPAARACVYRGVRAARARGRGLLLASHALPELAALAARLALLRRGELAAVAALPDCRHRFCGGYAVSCRVSRGAARAAWRRVRGALPHARLAVLHDAVLHAQVPERCTVDAKEVRCKLSDVFSALSALQAAGHIADFTVNQTSLDQMFLSFTDKSTVNLYSDTALDNAAFTPDEDHLDTVTSL